MPIRNCYHVYQRVPKMNENAISEAWILKKSNNNDHCQRLSNYKINIKKQ